MESNEQQEIVIAFLTLVISLPLSAAGAGFGMLLFSDWAVLPGLAAGMLLGILLVLTLKRKLIVKRII